MSVPDLPADVVEAKQRFAEGEPPKVAQDNTVDSEPKPTDPAEDFHVPEVAEDPHHDDVDVALQEGKETQDGQGDEEVPPANFQGYADPTADDGEAQS